MTERPPIYEKDHEDNLAALRTLFPQAAAGEVNEVYNAQRLQLESTAKNFQYVPFFSLRDAKEVLGKRYPTTNAQLSFALSPPYESRVPTPERRRSSWLTRWLMGQ